jgi:hypothetical protein
MRKVLLTVMMVSSLLAFNACKKDGAVGPAGPAGPAGANGATGATGPAGAVGAAGAKGADGTKILTGTAAPAAADGAVGDWYLQRNGATTVLWGPKVAAGWPATGTSLVGAAGAAGANGATGANGKDGSNFLAGAGVPTAATGVTGDFYFDTNSSTFYGPKLADGTWGSTVLPLGSAFAAKTYTITKGFENVTQVTKSFGQDAAISYANFDIITTFELNADDMQRIANYPKWSENREMVFETTAGSGVFDAVLTNYALINAAGTPFQQGRRFMYTHNTANPNTTFDFTAADISRLTANSGGAFEYWTYAKVTSSESNPGNSYTPANPNELVMGKKLSFARSKKVTVTTASGASENFTATYRATTSFNLNTLVPNYEKYRQDGKVFAKYKYYTANSATASSNNVQVIHPGNAAGWVDITAYANSYVLGTGGYSDAVSTANPFTGVNFMGTAQPFGTVGTAITVGTDQTATATATVPTGGTANKVANGDFHINWNLVSGSNPGNSFATVSYGPTTILTVTNGVRAAETARATNLTFYSVPQLSVTGNVWSSSPAVPLTLSGAGDLSLVQHVNGKDAAYFTNTKLVQVQVFVVPGDVVKALKAKGVNTDNMSEIAKNIEL